MTATKAATKRPSRARSCRHCGARVAQPPTGRPRLYCSTSCRQQAHRRRQSSRPPVWHRKQSDEWATPRDRLEEWAREFGPFDLDVAADEANAVTPRFYTLVEDGLSQPWTGTVWCNPPYSNVAKWIAKAHQAAQEGATVVCLVPARTDTRWWHEHVTEATGVRFLKGRLKFGDATAAAPFPSALVVFRPPAP